MMSFGLRRLGSISACAAATPVTQMKLCPPGRQCEQGARLACLQPEQPKIAECAAHPWPVSLRQLGLRIKQCAPLPASNIDVLAGNMCLWWSALWLLSRSVQLMQCCYWQPGMERAPPPGQPTYYIVVSWHLMASLSGSQPVPFKQSCRSVCTPGEQRPASQCQGAEDPGPAAEGPPR